MRVFALFIFVARFGRLINLHFVSRSLCAAVPKTVQVALRRCYLINQNQWNGILYARIYTFPYVYIRAYRLRLQIIFFRRRIALFSAVQIVHFAHLRFKTPADDWKFMFHFKFITERTTFSQMPSTSTLYFCVYTFPTTAYYSNLQSHCKSLSNNNFWNHFFSFHLNIFSLEKCFFLKKKKYQNKINDIIN